MRDVYRIYLLFYELLSHEKILMKGMVNYERLLPGMSNFDTTAFEKLVDGS